jgi:pyruvate kinase
LQSYWGTWCKLILLFIIIVYFKNFVIVQCQNSAKLGEKKNMNLPGAIVNLPTLTENDEVDLVEFGLK